MPESGTHDAAAIPRSVEIEGVRLHLARPLAEIPDWIGQRDVLLPLLAAWTLVDEGDQPLHPRLLGKPGVGKTTLACAAAHELGLPVFVMQATMDTRPEDLLVSPVLDPQGGLRYVASPLVTAMLAGGALVLDEGNRMSEKSWASLAPLLDHRRYVESAVAGIRIAADPRFRFVTTMNEDASTFEIPEYIHSRLMPQIVLDFPEEEEERAILRARVPFADEEVLAYVLRFLRAAHAADLRYTARDGINLVRYAMKVLHRREAPDARAAVRRALAPERLAPRVAPGIRLAPVVHEALESAALVRALLEHFDPAAVAVELPATLGAAALTAADRLPRLSLVVSEHQGEEPLVWLATPGEPFAEALRWAGARGRGRFLVDPDLPYTERHRDPVPDPYALFSLAPAAWFDLVARAAADRHGEEDARREAGMAHLVQRARAALGSAGELLVFAGAAHLAGLRRELARPAPAPFARPRRARVEVRHLHPESLPALLREPPLAQAVWELRRDGGAPPETAFERTVAPRVVLARGGLRLLAGAESATAAERAAEVARFAARHAVRSLVRGQAAPDRWALGRIAWRIAAASHHEATEERLTPWQRRLFLDFARRCARLGGRLVPGLYEWIVAGRGVADDNFAWELFDALTCYPWQAAEAELPTVRVEGDELDLGTRRLRFRLRFRRTKQRPVALPVRRRPRPEGPEDAADWLRPFLGGGLCSYPPEDLVVEEYGRHLAARARSLLADERSRSEPFTTSLLDGVDLRETLRRWAEDGRVWVHERGRAPGAAGAVVVIFDRDRANERFPFAMTWHGEHHQESDMAFYATDPAAQVVGPGILRATYGGFLLTHPPGRLWDPWRDPDYAFAREKAELLLAAGIDYSPERLIVYVAREAPPSRLTRYAARQGKRVVYLPLGSLSPATVRKVRVVHLLAGHATRRIAREYVW